MRIREDAVVTGAMDEDHPNRANGFMNLGVVLAEREPWEAIKMHSIALDIRRRTTKYEADQLHGLALNLLNIGRCWWMVHRLEEAASCFQECLALMKSREALINKRFPL